MAKKEVGFSLKLTEEQKKTYATNPDLALHVRNTVRRILDGSEAQTGLTGTGIVGFIESYHRFDYSDLLINSRNLYIQSYSPEGFFNRSSYSILTATRAKDRHKRTVILGASGLPIKDLTIDDMVETVTAFMPDREPPDHTPYGLFTIAKYELTLPLWNFTLVADNQAFIPLQPYGESVLHIVDNSAWGKYARIPYPHCTVVFDNLEAGVVVVSASDQHMS